MNHATKKSVNWIPHRDANRRNSSASPLRQILPEVTMMDPLPMTVKITDTTMRDGHQSLQATRMPDSPVILSADHARARPCRRTRRNLGRGHGVSQDVLDRGTLGCLPHPGFPFDFAQDRLREDAVNCVRACWQLRMTGELRGPVEWA